MSCTIVQLLSLTSLPQVNIVQYSSDLSKKSDQDIFFDNFSFILLLYTSITNLTYEKHFPFFSLLYPSTFKIQKSKLTTFNGEQ
jgi:hypothetical protein